MTKISSNIVLGIVIFFCCISCNNSKSNNPVDNDNTGESAQSHEKNQNSGCNCEKSNIESVAYKFMREFNETQNNVDSDVARTISLDEIRDNGNCTWQVQFKVSWPFGNTDGAHPDEFITKIGFCNSNQVFIQ